MSTLIRMSDDGIRLVQINHGREPISRVTEMLEELLVRRVESVHLESFYLRDGALAFTTTHGGIVLPRLVCFPKISVEGSAIGHEGDCGRVCSLKEQAATN